MMPESNNCGEDFSLLKQRGLIGERDVPFNPEFITSGYANVMIQRYQSVAKLCNGKVVLDVGCGLGWGVNLISESSSKIVGIDYDEDVIEYCREQYSSESVQFEVMDCRSLTFQPDTFDVVLLMETIEHLSLKDGYKCIREIVHCLKPDGMIVGSTYIAPTENEKVRHLQRSDNEHHLHIYTMNEMSSLLSSHFQKYEIMGVTAFTAAIPKKAHETDPLLPAYNVSGNGNKRILFTTSAAPSQTPFSTTEKRPPVGIGFLIAVLRNAGHEIFFIDNYLKPANFLETDYLQKNKIDIVGIYANTICYRDTLRMLYKLHYYRIIGKWSGKIIVGGPHTTVALESIPDFVDYVVQGEGERAILDIVEGRVNKRVVQYPPIKNLDELPMPAWDYFIQLPYKWDVDWFPEKPVFTMNTSRGCPFQCAFCSVGSIWGKRYNYFSAKRLVSDIEYLIKHFGAKGIYFREDNFTLNRNRLTEFCNLLLGKGISIPWACETRVNTLDRELIELMSRAGARAFYLGVESGSQRILDFLDKGITVEQIKNAFTLCREYGIKTAASIIVGVPSETEEDILKTVNLLDEVKPSVTWYNVFVGIPRSKLYHHVIDNRLYEFIDDRGLVYLKGHNARVKRYYGNQWNADVPMSFNQRNQLVNPEISVVMSTHNSGTYLKKAVISILNQTYQNFELIIVDDASTDNTSEIIKEIDDPRIRVISNAENIGLTKSLNVGIRHSRGNYIARMDADDIALPHRFGTQIEFLKNNQDHALVGSSYYQIDDLDNIHSLVKVLTENAQIKKGLKSQNWFGHGSVMMRKDVLNEVGGYDEKYAFAQDYDLWLRIAESHKVANIKEPLYCWRSTSSCISREKEEEQQYFADMAKSEARNRETSAVRTGPLVSVIVPTYNRPGMLAETIKSILNQTFKDFEIIVVNDAGEDVEDIVNDMNQANYVTYVKHAKNRGLAAARNTGIKLARGKYIAYLDDDDIFYPDHLETLVKVLEEGDYKVAYTDACRAHQIKEKGKYVIKNRDLPYSYDFDYEQILVTNFVPVLCFMHEKSCIDDTGFFDETLPVFEDWDLWIRISRKFKLVHIKKVTAEFRWRIDGTTLTSAGQTEFLNTGKRIFMKYQEYAKDKPHVLEAQYRYVRNMSERLGVKHTEIREDADKIKGLLSEAHQWKEQYNNHEVVKSCEKILMLDHSNTEALKLMGGAKLALGNMEAAEKYFRQLVTAEPGQDNLISLGMVQKDLKKFKEAIQTFEKAKAGEDGSNGMKVHLNLADCYTSLGLNDKGMENYHSARKLDNRDERPYIGIGVIESQRGNLNAARELFQKALDLNPRSSRALCGIGMLEMARGEKETAFVRFREALHMNGEDITALTLLVQVSYELGKLSEAEPYIESYLSLHPADMNVLYKHAEICFQLKQIDKAMEDVQKILIFEPDRQDALKLREEIMNVGKPQGTIGK